MDSAYEQTATRQMPHPSNIQSQLSMEPCYSTVNQTANKILLEELQPPADRSEAAHGQAGSVTKKSMYVALCVQYPQSDTAVHDIGCGEATRIALLCGSTRSEIGTSLSRAAPPLSRDGAAARTATRARPPLLHRRFSAFMLFHDSTNTPRAQTAAAWQSSARCCTD